MRRDAPLLALLGPLRFGKPAGGEPRAQKLPFEPSALVEAEHAPRATTARMKGNRSAEVVAKAQLARVFVFGMAYARGVLFEAHVIPA